MHGLHISMLYVLYIARCFSRHHWDIISLFNVRKLTDNPESGNSGPKPALISSNDVETFSDS